MHLTNLLTSFIWGAGAFFILLLVIVTVHELGHYLVGRWSGIKAEVFSIGFGPKLFSRKDRHGTLWQVAALPLGGFVKFLGDANPASAGPGVEVDSALRRQTLNGAPLWARFATLIAGPMFNFIFSTVVFAGLLMWQGTVSDEIRVGTVQATPPGVVNELLPGDKIMMINGLQVQNWDDFQEVSRSLPATDSYKWTVKRGESSVEVNAPHPSPPLISSVVARTPAAAAGIQRGDVVTAINDKPVSSFEELRQTVMAAEGAPVTLTYWRPNTGEMKTSISAKHQDYPLKEGGFEKRWLIGIQGGESFFTPAMTKAGLLDSVRSGAENTWGIITGSFSGLWALVTGQIGSCNMGGAVSIAQTTSHAASSGLADFIWWIGVFSAAVGFMNLLPIPVLDGGHLAFYTWEAITGRPPTQRALAVLSAIGLSAVLTLMLFGLFNDLRC